MGRLMTARRKRKAAPRRSKPTAAALTADEYLMGHWTNKRLWRSNGKGHHLVRFEFVANAVAGGRFLDCGCAFGHSTEQLATMRPGQWEGADFSRQGIETARENFPALTFHFIERLENMDALGRFDSVVLSEVLEHVEDDRALVEAVMRITPRLVVTTPCRNVGDPGHRRVYTKQTLERLFRGYAAIISQRTPFFFAVVTPKGRRSAKIIGDSHAFYTFRNIPGVINQHIGPITLKRVGYKEDRAVQDAVNKLNPSPDDTFLFLFGEIDVRTFVKPWYERRQDKTTLDAMLGEWARLYAEAIDALALNGARRGIISVPPPAVAAGIHAKSYPVKGTDEERAEYTRILNRHLKAECEARTWPYVDIYSAFADERGLLRLEVIERETHIKDCRTAHGVLAGLGLVA